MKYYYKIFKDTKWFMYIPFAFFNKKLAAWILEPEEYVDRGWRFIFAQFNLMCITLPSIIIVPAIIIHFIK